LNRKGRERLFSAESKGEKKKAVGRDRGGEKEGDGLLSGTERAYGRQIQKAGKKGLPPCLITSGEGYRWTGGGKGGSRFHDCCVGKEEVKEKCRPRYRS